MQVLLCILGIIEIIPFQRDFCRVKSEGKGKGDN